jgi:hypothetical protein
MLDVAFTGSWSQRTSSSTSVSVDLETFALKELGALGGATVGLKLFFTLPGHRNLSEDIQQSCLTVTINGM